MSKKIELLPKAVAANRLNLSVRRVMELSNEGKLTRHRAYDPETKREAFMFDAAEIQALQDLKDYDVAAVPDGIAGRPRLMIEAPGGESSEDGDGRGDGRLWLTLAEAAAYTGLPASHLRSAIGNGELPALDVGPRPGGHWRVRRLDLDAIEGRRVGAKTLRI